LFYAVRTIIGTRPTSTDLHVMAMSNFSAFHKFVQADQAQLEDIYRRALELPALRPPLAPGEFTVFGTLALGILLPDPVARPDSCHLFKPD
jgi:hypothetical protein